MLFMITSILIALLCVWGVIKSARERNLIGLGFSAISVAVFGWFGVISIIAEIKDLLQA